MIALVKLDAATTCLDRMESGTGLYVCRAPAGHAGPHDYLPIDMVIIDEADSACEQEGVLALDLPPLY